MTVAGLVAAVLVVTASALLLPASARGRLGVPPAPEWPMSSRGRLARIAVLGGGLGAALLWAEGRMLALTVIGLLAGAAVLHLVGRSHRAARAEATSEAVLAACAGLAADLRAGEPPRRALERAVEEWAELAPVASAAALGADVPGALRALARQHPGAEQLATVAAAWQVAHRSGAGLAAAVSRAADTIVERRTTRRLLGSELASAHATARLMAVLPLVMLLLGGGPGGDPVGFLTTSPVGIGCLATGLLLSYLGMLWLDRIAAGVLR